MSLRKQEWRDQLQGVVTAEEIRVMFRQAKPRIEAKIEGEIPNSIPARTEAERREDDAKKLNR